MRSVPGSSATGGMDRRFTPLWGAELHCSRFLIFIFQTVRSAMICSCSQTHGCTAYMSSFNLIILTLRPTCIWCTWSAFNSTILSAGTYALGPSGPEALQGCLILDLLAAMLEELTWAHPLFCIRLGTELDSRMPCQPKVLARHEIVWVAQAHLHFLHPIHDGSCTWMGWAREADLPQDAA